MIASWSHETLRRRVKLAMLHVAKALGLFAVMRRATAGYVRILCYHGIWLGSDDYPGDMMFMHPKTFARRLDLIQRLGYPVVPLSAAVEALQGRGELPAAAVVITIDDGWYGTYSEMLPALRQRDMPATLYCDSAHLMSGQPIAHVMATYVRMLAGHTERWPDVEFDYAIATDRHQPIATRLAAVEKVAHVLGVDLEPFRGARAFDYMSPAELAESASSGLDVQLHTHNHTMHDLSRQQVAREIAANRDALGRVLGRDSASFRHFCYPNGVTSRQTAGLLDDLGMTSSTTLAKGLARPGTNLQLLPRLLDGEQVTDIEFEARLSGLSELRNALFGRDDWSVAQRAGGPDSPMLYAHLPPD